MGDQMPKLYQVMFQGFYRRDSVSDPAGLPETRLAVAQRIRELRQEETGDLATRPGWAWRFRSRKKPTPKEAEPFEFHWIREVEVG